MPPRGGIRSGPRGFTRGRAGRGAGRTPGRGSLGIRIFGNLTHFKHLRIGGTQTLRQIALAISQAIVILPGGTSFVAHQSHNPHAAAHPTA